MMNVKLLPIFVITLAAVSTVSFGMEIVQAPKYIKILCKDDQQIELLNTKRVGDVPGLGDILATSKNIEGMLESFESARQLKNGEELTITESIPFTNMTSENFNRVYEYMQLIASNKNQDIDQKLQSSSLSDLCLGLQGCDYLDVKDNKDVSFIDTKLRPAIACKFNYKNDQDFKIIEKVDLVDHKQVIGQCIAEKLSLTTICMSQANTDLTDKNQSPIKRNSILGKALDDVKNSANTSLRSATDPITSASEKGDVFVFGYKSDPGYRDVVVIGHLEDVQDIPSYSNNQLERLLFFTKGVSVWGSQRDYPMLDGSKVSAQRLGYHTKAVVSVDLHPTKLLLVTADEQEVKLWNLSTKSCVRTFNKDSDGKFDPETIRFNEDGDKIISGSDDNNPLSSWEFHEPYEVLRYLMDKKKALGDKKSFIDDILKHVPVDSRVSWSQWLWNNKYLLSGGLVIGGLLYYKRGALLSFLRSCFNGKL